MLEGHPVLARGLGPSGSQVGGHEGEILLKLRGILGIWGAYDPNDYMKNVNNKKKTLELFPPDLQHIPLDECTPPLSPSPLSLSLSLLLRGRGPWISACKSYFNECKYKQNVKYSIIWHPFLFWFDWDTFFDMSLCTGCLIFSEQTLPYVYMYYCLNDSI